MILWTIFLWSYNGIRSYSLLIIFLIISLLIIYCITGNLYLSVLFNYFTHPQPLLLAQPICSMYLRVCFHFVCWFVLFVLDSTRNQEHVFVFHCLTYFTQDNTCKIHPCCYYKWQDFIFYGWVIVHLYVLHLLFPFICL